MLRFGLVLVWFCTRVFGFCVGGGLGCGVFWVIGGVLSVWAFVMTFLWMLRVCLVVYLL